MMRLPFFLALLLIMTAATAVADHHQEGEVRWISDGDTITVDGIGVVRLVGIDCPEMEASDRDWKYLKLGSPSGQILRTTARSAHDRAWELCLGKQVRLQAAEPRYDRYGRLLAYVWLPDGRMLNQILLEEGQAMVYRRFDFEEKNSFLRLEHQARRQKKGMWRTKPS